MGPGRLTPELAEAVSAAGDYWGYQVSTSAKFREDVQSADVDLGRKPERLTAALTAWETWDPGERPNQREVLWSKHRTWLKRAAGLRVGKPGQQRMDGGIRGLSVVKNPQFETKAEYMARMARETAKGAA